MSLPDGLFGALKALVDSDPRTAGLPFTQGVGKARADAIYCVARLKAWSPSLRTSDSTWYDCRVELRLHAPSPEAAEAAAALVSAVLAPERPATGPALDWATGGTGPPMEVTRRREHPRGYTAGGAAMAVDVVELRYAATGTPGGGAGSGATTGTGEGSAGFGSDGFGDDDFGG